MSNFAGRHFSEPFAKRKTFVSYLQIWNYRLQKQTLLCSGSDSGSSLIAAAATVLVVYGCLVLVVVDYLHLNFNLSDIFSTKDILQTIFLL